jgi:hypothetical protein
VITTSCYDLAVDLLDCRQKLIGVECVAPVTKGPREEISFSGLPMSSMVGWACWWVGLVGEPDQRRRHHLHLAVLVTSTRGSAHLGWQYVVPGQDVSDALLLPEKKFVV